MAAGEKQSFFCVPPLPSPVITAISKQSEIEKANAMLGSGYIIPKKMYFIQSNDCDKLYIFSTYRIICGCRTKKNLLLICDKPAIETFSYISPILPLNEWMNAI